MAVLRGRTGNPDPPQQHTQPSRKGKKAWRKNIDITEVKKGLEDLNEEIIQGGVIAEKESTELFILDTAGDSGNTKRIPKVKALKADEIIAARSVIPAVSSKKRPADKTTDGILPIKRQRTNYVSRKELIRIKKVADGHHESTVDVVDATYDPWAADTTPAPGPVAKHEKNEWLPEPTKAKAPSTLAKKPISLTASGKPVPAVPKPAGGYSYNPVVTDYITRLDEEGEKAIAAERKRLEEIEADRKKQEAAARSAAEAEAAEARAELSEWDEDSAWEGIDSDAEGVLTKRPKRKTPAQRNKVKRRKAEEGRRKHEAAEKRKEEQAKHIQELVEAVEEKQRQRALSKIEMTDDESEEGDDAELRRRQLGKFKLPERDLELVLPDELQDSLRRLKPEGNLLKDRYRSLLVRGRLEARRKIPFRKQAKVKFTEKWGHKDFDISRL